MNYSVLMSVYQKEQPEYLLAAVESMLNQTVPPSDFVIVCDGPLTEELNQVTEDFKQQAPELFQIVRLEENKGLGLALKEGLTHCKEDLVARMDTDDIALSDRMEKQLRFFKEHPEISVVGGQIAEFEETPQHIARYRIVPETHEDIINRMRFSNPINHMTVTYKKSHILACGNYPHHPGFEDYHLWVKLACAGYRFQNVDQICCYVRAGISLVQRRKGFSYFSNAFRLQKLLLDQHFITHLHFFRNIVIRFIANVLLPASLYEKLFSRFMRRKKFQSFVENSHG